jgi:hypothetical protein
VQLSKSDYTTYLKHPAWLWIKKHAKEMLPPIDAATQAIFDTGHDFEQYPEAQFPDAVILGFSDYKEYLSLPERTTQALENGAKTIFQGRFEHEQLTFICDVIDVVGESEVDLYEIKSTASAKPEHNTDLAFQMVVLEKCGFSVRNIAVMHVNNQYVRDGDIEPEKLTATTDVTEAVKEIRDYTLEKIDEALATMALSDCPDTSPLLANKSYFKEWLEIYRYMKKTKPGSIYDLCQMDVKTLASLQDNKIEYLKDIPANFILKPKQSLQVQSAKQGGPGYDTEKIKQFLDTFKFPLYFFDYETSGGLVPPFDGMRPYQQLPFQYSLHILDSPDAELRHEEYLHTENSNPAEPLSKTLKSQIGEKGTILAWNMSFEKSCNTMLGELVPEYAYFYEKLNDRIVDLMLPFSSNWYVDSEFKGSASIKAVLPVLAPELSYKSLNVQEGQSASRIWTETFLSDKNEADKPQILSDLREYCEMDTYAMVKIYQVLTGI